MTSHLVNQSRVAESQLSAEVGGAYRRASCRGGVTAVRICWRRVAPEPAVGPGVGEGICCQCLLEGGGPETSVGASRLLVYCVQGG